MVKTMVLATTGTSGGKSKKAPIKVKQDMIDFIKTQGMTKALKRAGSISAKGTKGEAEFLEGVRRMYGANRLSAATKAAAPKKGSYQAGAGMAKKGTYTTGSGVSKPAAKTVTKPASKGMSGSTKAKIAGGAILAGGLLAAKATPAGRAAGAALGLGKAVAGAVGRKTATKALSTSGKMAAKAKRPVSQSQYDAMKKVASKPKKFTKTKAAASGAGAVSMVPKPKKK
jgi:hypothetical protein